MSIELVVRLIVQAQTPNPLAVSSKFRGQTILHLAVETAATQTKPACAGYNTRDFQSAQADFVSIAPDFESEGILLASGIPVSRPE